MSVNSHAPLLKKPDDKQLLYKVIPSKYFFAMLKGNYLHFRRTDVYKDKIGDDLRDSDLTDSDKIISEKSTFEKSPNYTLKNYYESLRAKTYVCCFSTQNSDYLWKEYGGGDNNAVCSGYTLADKSYTRILT